jgi:nucleotide-binding universal stress UspA family protein
MALPSSILCPVDFSVHAERALRHAVALAGAFHTRLTVVTVNDPLLVASVAAAGHAGTLRDQVEAALTEMLERIPAHTQRVLPAIDIVTGEAAPEILNAAARAEADLIVMGSQGLGGTSKLVFGSTAERVMRAAQVPVLVVPAHAPERIAVEHGATRFTLGTVVAALGLGPADDELARVAAEWAAATGSSLVLTHVCHAAPAPGWWPFLSTPVTPESLAAARTQLDNVAQTLPSSAAVAIDVRQGAVPAGVATVTRDRNAGLLVVSRGDGRHRLGAVAYRIMCEADLPTLVVAGH